MRICCCCIGCALTPRHHDHCTLHTHSTHAHDTQVELHTVASTILQLPRIENPSDADVAQWHSKYMDHLEALFERHKGRFGYAHRKLEML